MTHKATKTFWRRFYSLPAKVQSQTRQRFNLLKKNPNHPSLHFKKVGKFWSARITDTYRAIAIKKGETFIWVWIGTHDEYNKLLK